MRKPDRIRVVYRLLVFVQLVLAGVLSIGLQAVEAEETSAQEVQFDRFMIRGGYAYVFNADTILSINGTSGLGAVVDFSRVLKGERDDNAWRLDSLYRFNARHSIGFSYYDVSRSGNSVLTESITIGDTTYGIGSQLKSSIDIAMYRLFYNYSFYHNEKVELGVSAGLYFANIKTGFNGNLFCTGGPSCTPGGAIATRSEDTRLIAPLPSFGVLMNYNFTPRLVGQARFDWFYVDTNQFKGAMNEVYIGLEYRLFKHFALGAAFDRLDVSLNYDPEEKTGWKIRNDWNMVYMFGSLYF